MRNSYSNLPVVSIAGSDVQQITYKGEPVVTFAMVDDIHRRPKDTARRNFNENRDRFIEGEDFIELTSDEIRTMSEAGVFPPRTARGTVLTKRGYLKLTKPMSDDRAWEVQGEMVDRYFMVEQIVEAIQNKSSGNAREARLFLKQAMGLAKIAGLRGNQMLIAANRATREAVGFDHLSAMGLSYLEAPENDVLLNATSIGQELGAVSAVRVNHLLAEHGYQTGKKDAKGRGYWLPTKKGIAAGGQMVDVERSNKSGQARQLRWASRIIDELRKLIGEAA